MFTNVYFKQSYDDKITLEARPASEISIKNHLTKSNGIPIRLYVLDANEERKFIDKLGRNGVFLSDQGEQGFIGYYDYCIEDDDTITSQMMYIHPFHRNRSIANRLMNCIEENLTQGSTFNELIAASPYIASEIDRINQNGKIIVNYITA